MKYYWVFIINVAVALVSGGVILPALFSSQSTFLVALGFVILFGALPLFHYRLNKPYVKSFLKEKENDDV